MRIPDVFEVLSSEFMATGFPFVSECFAIPLDALDFGGDGLLDLVETWLEDSRRLVSWEVSIINYFS